MENKGNDKPSEGKNIVKIADVVAMANEGALEVLLSNGSRVRLAGLNPRVNSMQIILTYLGGNKYEVQAYETGNAQSAPMRTVSEYNPGKTIGKLGYTSPIVGVHTHEPKPEINMAANRYTGLTGRAGLDKLFSEGEQ